MSVAVPAALKIKPLEVIEFTIHPDYKQRLVAIGLEKFEDFLYLEGIEAMRDVPGRLTVSLDFGESKAYLKRHWGHKAGLMKKSGPHFEAQTEWDNTRLLESRGISVPTPLAYGLGRAGGKEISFYLSASVRGVQSDHYLDRSNLTIESKKVFIERLAAFAKLIHESGFNHRDFYLCHLFANELGDDFEFALIDLQRVQERSAWRYRWLIKDLTQLLYSVPKSFSRSECLRWYFLYKGIKTLSKEDKKMIGDVQKKTAKLRARCGDYIV